MNRRMGPETETQKAFREFGDAWEKFTDELYKQLEPIMDKLADWLEEFGPFYDEE